MYEFSLNGHERHPCLPGDMVHGAIKNAAKAKRLGKQFDRNVFVEEHMCPLIYEGPKDIVALYEDGKFIDQRMVNVRGSKVLRTRPFFDKWELKFTISFVEEEVDESDVVEAADRAGTQIGLGDYTPKYGRFEVVSCREAAS